MRVPQGYARYIGRVGALAVALGVGVAVATGQGVGVARADTEGSSADASPRDSSSADSPADTAETGTPPADSGPPSPDSPPSAEPITSTAPVDEGQDPVEATDDNPYVPEMNYDGGVEVEDEDSAQTTEGEEEEETPPPPPPPSGEQVPPPAGPPAAPPGQDGPEGTVAQDNSTSPKPSAPGTDVVEDVVKEQDPTTTTDSGAPPHGRMATTLDEDFAAGGQTMLLSTATTGEDSALTLTQPDALAVQQTGPVDALLGIPGAMVSVATTVVAALLSPFLAPGPVAPAEPPLLWAVLAWVRREVQRTFFNRTPEAVVDTVTTSEDAPKVIDALGNDTDFEDDPITITSFTQPAHGTVVQNADGTLTYTPVANYNGPDSFTYTVRDQGLHIVKDFVRLLTGAGPRTDTAAVNITVAAVNDAPVAVDDTNTTAEDTPASGNVLTNDTDIDTPASGLSAALGTQAAKGTAVVNADGSYTYTPGANYTGTDTFTYTVSDGAHTDTGTVTVTVTAANDAPVANPDALSTNEDTPLHFGPADLLANDSDIDGDPLITFVQAPGHGTLTVKPDGTYTYAPDPNFNGTDTFTYVASDGTTTSNPTTVTITINPVNDAPTAVDDTKFIAEDTAVSGNVLTNDTDIDTPAAGLSAALGTQAANGTAVLNADGTYTYTPGTNFTGTDTFTYTISDGTLTDTGTVTIVLAAAPTISTVNATILGEKSTLTIDIDASDPHGLPLTYTASGGTLTPNADGTFTYTPDDPNPTFRSFVLTVDDGVRSTQVYVPVARFNYAVERDGVLEVEILSPETPTGFSLATGQATLVDHNTDGSGYVHSRYHLPSGTDLGTNPLTLTFNAPNGTTISTTIVMPAAPAITGVSATILGEKNTLTIDIDASDPHGLPLTYTATGGTLTPNADGTFTYTPDDPNPTFRSFHLTVDDGVRSTGVYVPVTRYNIDLVNADGQVEVLTLSPETPTGFSVPTGEAILKARSIDDDGQVHDVYVLPAGTDLETNPLTLTFNAPNGTTISTTIVMPAAPNGEESSPAGESVV